MLKLLDKDNTVFSVQDYDMWGYLFENRTFGGGRYKFTGKERDEESSYDYFGARYYMSRIGRWGSVEPLMDKYLAYSPYNYSLLNPIRLIDFDGRKPTDGILLVFPDYKIRTKGVPIPFLGHSGVLLIDNETGKTVYYDFGRFYGHKKGFIRTNEELGKVSFDDEGLPTESSLDEVLKNISEEYGHKGDIEGIYIKSKEFEKMQEYAESERNKIIEEKEFEHYNIIINSCLHFSIKTIEADKNIDLPTAITPIPTEYIRIVRWLYDYEEVDYEAD